MLCFLGPFLLIHCLPARRVVWLSSARVITPGLPTLLWGGTGVITAREAEGITALPVAGTPALH